MKWLGVVVLLVLSAFFGLMTLGHVLLVEEMRELWANGKVAEGTLVAHHARKKSTLREYSYTFEAGGATVTAERRTIPYGAASLPVGTKLVVRHDPQDPSRSVTPAELQEHENWANRALLPLIAIAFLVGAIFVARRGPRRAPST
jgi:hypothetical protein